MPGISTSGPLAGKGRLSVFLFCSLALHMAMVGMLGNDSLAWYGFASGRAHTMQLPAPVTVRLLPAEDARGNGIDVRLNVSATSSRGPSATVISRAAPISAYPAADTTQEAISRTTGPQPQLTLPEFVSSGQLTRLPAPAHHIDLNIADITLLPYEGKVDLTIFIDAAGMVARVAHAGEGSDAEVFAELVAERFRKARFVPGEIDGRPVPSQVRITVVSESLAAPAHAESGSAPAKMPEIQQETR